uniref:Putative LOV domain-containing protein n=1 Tax=Chaetosphaeridium globosum TaxID=96477 RepID=A0A126WWX5_CHAGL|nr:putative LOV domain-containing protein [Chaetosphaeridium globosum]
MVSLTRIQQSFVLVNPHIPDMPITYASDGFCRLSGYEKAEVEGRNCRFLQGPDTDPAELQKMRLAIEERRPCTVCLLNYRKDGQAFWNSLHIAPVWDSKGQVAYFVGVQLDVTLRGPAACGAAERVKQLGAVGAVRVAVRGLEGDGLRRHPSGSMSHHPSQPPSTGASPAWSPRSV